MNPELPGADDQRDRRRARAASDRWGESKELARFTALAQRESDGGYTIQA